MPKKQKGILRAFTLIELLIVIAIIAILALIAIPNFLEAQTRSKIARAMADMRSLSVAVEAYYIDYNSYIMSAHDCSGFAKTPFTAMAHQNRFGWYAALTTPVAYITAIPRDPFSQAEPLVMPGPKYYLFYSGNFEENDTAPKTVYAMVCVGPDLVNNLYNLLAADTARMDINYVNTDKTHDLPYDPSNGTISGGDIFRAGGPGDFSQYFPKCTPKEIP
ncbi:MAG: prepilin-type N-terminal cleavage/methylation domain-containing protein [Candidatus Sumerlaeota bacterium]|nr:prepilin-type N-terminal cleavage/methylation domain-containing protein [Candidatus Sumerlaeota bacterium]